MDHAMPPEGSGEVSGGRGRRPGLGGARSARPHPGLVVGWFFFGAEGSPQEAAALAELRERVGGERFDRFQRSRERDRHPRLLTESERDLIQMATAPVLRDLEASGAIMPEIGYQSSGDEGDGREGVSADITLGGGRGGSVWVPTGGCSSAGQVWWAAHALQEWEVRELWAAGRSASWPECPEHPGTHPLEPGIDDQGSAVWRCPRTQQVVWAIGALRS